MWVPLADVRLNRRAVLRGAVSKELKEGERSSKERSLLTSFVRFCLDTREDLGVSQGFLI